MGYPFLRFVSILLLIFEKGDGQKLDQVLFQICKYTFLIFGKGDKPKNWPWFFLRFVNILLLIFEKGDPQKIGQGFWRFVSILFLIFEKRDQQDIRPSFFQDL